MSATRGTPMGAESGWMIVSVNAPPSHRLVKTACAPFEPLYGPGFLGVFDRAGVAMDIHVSMSAWEGVAGPRPHGG
jgi:hypothetical protein